MRSCAGQLVVHGDGTVAYCTEERAGRRCTGEERLHRAGTFACRLVAGDDCGHCNLAPTATSH